NGSGVVAATAGSPVIEGWFAQLTVPTFHEEAARWTRYVRGVWDTTLKLSEADVIRHRAGTDGRTGMTRMRRTWPTPACTAIGAVPSWLDPGALSTTMVSQVTERVSVP